MGTPDRKQIWGTEKSSELQMVNSSLATRVKGGYLLAVH